jgi:hypothetical protein
MAKWYFLFGLTALLALVFGPHVTIWALNTVFNLHIGHGLVEWAAVLWLCVVLNGARK